jgi:hypothetical protein
VKKAAARLSLMNFFGDMEGVGKSGRRDLEQGLASTPRFDVP